MKKKNIFFGISILEIIISIYSIIFRNDILESNLIKINQMMERVGEESQKLFSNIIDNMSTTTIIINAVMCIIIAICIILMAYKDNFSKYRTKLIVLSIIGYTFSDNNYIGLLFIIELIMSVCIKKEKIEIKKEKKELPVLEKHSTNLKEIILGMLFIVFYFSDNILANYIPKSFIIPYIILFEIVLIILAILLYRTDLKRDLNVLKDNFKLYITYALKKWGIMLLVMVIVNIIITAITGEIKESVNQQMLQKLPLLYVIPSAIIMAPIVEETIFRVILRKIIRNDKVFIIISGILFGMLHVTHEPTIISMITSSIPYIVMGCFMAHAYVKTNNMTTSMFIHAFQNTLGCISLLSV